MKLRIHGNSIRLRLLRSEVAKFIETGRIAETVVFALGDDAVLTYALQHISGLANVEVRYNPSEITVVLPTGQAASWADSNQVGVYSTIDFGKQGKLDIIVEKDFACLDLSDVENQDTFSNPQMKAC